MPVSQITIRATPELKAAFRQYADSLWLKDSELAKLLIARERKRKHLAGLKVAGELTQLQRDPGSGGSLPTITAHLPSVHEVANFDTYANECGLSRSRAGLHLLELELRERWLERSLESP